MTMAAMVVWCDVTGAVEVVVMVEVAMGVVVRPW